MGERGKPETAIAQRREVKQKVFPRENSKNPEIGTKIQP